MNRPWQVWLWFGLCLAAALPALAWLTVNALRLEAAESLARRESRREEQLRLALWRLDTRVSPIVAQEIARPYYSYSSFYSPTTMNGVANGVANGIVDGTAVRSSAVASPLLVQPSDYILLNFSATPQGGWTSPQVPQDTDVETAIFNGATNENVRRSQERLADLAAQINLTELRNQLPAQTIPAPPEWVAGTNRVLAGDSAYASELKSSLAEAQGANSFAQSPPLKGGSWSNAEDLQKRQDVLANEAVQSRLQQTNTANFIQTTPVNVAEGVFKPIWIGSHLVLARRVRVGDETIVQGSWLNWPKLARELEAEAADVLPDVRLVPVRGEIDLTRSHLLATLPVELVAPPLAAAASEWTPLRTSLAIAWVCLVMAAAAIAALLAGMVRLDQRREAFVSAVTHELRTPLTTFRMYSEMLDEGMVADPAQQKLYTRTLRVESDRLAHLVENVLSYAQLERGRYTARRERLTVSEILNRVRPRLVERARQAEMDVELQWDDSVGRASLWTDPTAVEQILFNLVDNACKYASRSGERTIHVTADAEGAAARIMVRDHGPGISLAESRRLFRPFSKSAQQAALSAPGVGLGLALCRRTARQIGGDLRYEPSAKQGATFVLTLPLDG